MAAMTVALKENLSVALMDDLSVDHWVATSAVRSVAERVPLWADVLVLMSVALEAAVWVCSWAVRWDLQSVARTVEYLVDLWEKRKVGRWDDLLAELWGALMAEQWAESLETTKAEQLADMMECYLAVCLVVMWVDLLDGLMAEWMVDKSEGWWVVSVADLSAELKEH